MSFIEIGTPTQMLPIVLISHDYSNIIMKYSCPIKSNYDFSSSKSVKIFYESNNVRYFYINDNISFDDKNKNILMTFIHYNESDKQDNICVLLVLNLLNKTRRSKIQQLIYSFN